MRRENTMNSKEKGYCISCDKDVDYKIVNEKREANVRGVKFSYDYKRAVCNECGEQVFPVSVGKLNQISMFDTYKKRVGLLTSEEIIRIRKNRGLTQTQLANIIGCGLKTIARYENGAIQDKIFDNFIRMIGDDFVYEHVFGKNNQFSSIHNLSMASPRAEEYVSAPRDRKLIVK